jgi:bis(5'-nucleosidyl)-tetraphosphatase
MELKFDEKSCGVLVFRETSKGRFYLLLHYPNGHWDFAKGHVEEGEEEHETAHRELLEETGIGDLIFVDGFREEMSYKHNLNNKLSHKQVIFFLGKTDLEDIHLSHEHHDSLWLPYEEALEKLTYENAKEMLKKAEKFVKL